MAQRAFRGFDRTHPVPAGAPDLHLKPIQFDHFWVHFKHTRRLLLKKLVQSSEREIDRKVGVYEWRERIEDESPAQPITGLFIAIQIAQVRGGVLSDCGRLVGIQLQAPPE